MTPSESPRHPALADLPSLVERLVATARATFERRMDRWGAAVTAYGPRPCALHPEFTLHPDLERSVWESDRAKDLVIVFDPCPGCRAAEEERKARARLMARGIPERAVDMTLWNWDPAWEDTRAIERAMALTDVGNWVDRSPREPFLIILGTTCGTGKTALAVAALKAFGRNIRCVEFGDWIDRLISALPEERALMVQDLREYDALVIDDFGNRTIGTRDENGANPMERDAMSHVLNTRYERRLPTIITSNLDPRTFSRRLDPRTVDRIKAGRVLIDASDWPSRRAAEPVL